MADRALLIGVGEYRSLPSLPATVPSVDVLAEVLAGEPVARYQVRALRDISRELLLEEVNGFLSGATSSDHQVLYIACHGVAWEEDFYLAVADTERDHIRSTGVPLTFILDSAKGSRAGSTLVILDTCTSGQFPDEPSPQLSSRTKSSRNAVIVSARPRDQYSLRSGALFKIPCDRKEEKRTGGVERVMVGGVRTAIVSMEHLPVLEVGDEPLDRRAKRRDLRVVFLVGQG